MKEVDNLTPSVGTYNCMIVSSMKTKSIDKALDYFDDMKKVGTNPNLFTYSYLITGLRKSYRYHKALTLFERMKDEGFTPDEITYTSVIDTCGKTKNYARAITLFKELRNSNQHPYPGEICFATLLKVLGLGGLWRSFDR